MHRSLAAALLVALPFAAPAQQPPQGNTTLLGVNGMVCSFCAQGIEKRLGALPQTQAVYVDLKRKLVALEAKPGQAFDEARLRAEVSDAGYDVTKVEPSPRSIAELRASAKP
jgi:copper chaperone CopZ